ncbi:hypothetical protein AwErysi_04630 [Erysipelotrichaceae bacterium]|nr:hypothetical protein AwErysi_04630 [Erysipelotrichaceae bacterium]
MEIDAFLRATNRTWQGEIQLNMTPITDDILHALYLRFCRQTYRELQRYKCLNKKVVVILVYAVREHRSHLRVFCDAMNSLFGVEKIEDERCPNGAGTFFNPRCAITIKVQRIVSIISLDPIIESLIETMRALIQVASE